MSAPIHDFSVPLPEPHRITTRRPADAALRDAVERLHDKASDLADTVSRLHHGDTLASGKPVDPSAMRIVVRSYLMAEFDLRSACADLLGISNDVMVDENAGFLDVLCGAARRAEPASDAVEQRSAAA